MVNLLQCFDEEHPKYPLSSTTEAKNATLTAKASSQHTEAQQPPAFFVEYDPINWIQQAEMFLQSPKATTNLAFCNGSIADPEYEKAELRNEQDVVRVSNHYLIMPLVQAINVKYTKAITTASEHKQDVFRFDLSFNVNQDGGNDRKTIMVVEFKRLGVIKREEFEAAMCNEANMEKTAQDLMAKQKNTLIKQGCNAYWFAKQAAAYSVSSNCKYVALCSYDTLILLHFNNTLASVRMTVVKRALFRKALLGFLIDACDDAGLT